ncbi:hypothetical protein D9X30_5006 [Cupriavidus sp. U2]|nr:hypothetical protein D9X30_5006 [Cupriavidus sp. U2]
MIVSGDRFTSASPCLHRSPRHWALFPPEPAMHRRRQIDIPAFLGRLRQLLGVPEQSTTAQRDGG